MHKRLVALPGRQAAEHRRLITGGVTCNAEGEPLEYESQVYVPLHSRVAWLCACVTRTIPTIMTHYFEGRYVEP